MNALPIQTQKVAVDGMTCTNCEVVIERRFKDVFGVQSVRLDRKRGEAEIEHTGDVSIEQLQRAVAEDGYTVASLSGPSLVTENTWRDYGEIAGILIVLTGAALAAQHLGLMPRGLSISDGMTLGVVFLMGLAASVSTCMAVTGGLLVAVSAAYHIGTPESPGLQRLKPHLYFNAGRILSYTILGGSIAALGSALALSTEISGVLTLAASAIMIVLGLQMLRLLPRLGFTLIPKSLVHRIHGPAERKVAGGAFMLGALTFFLPCGFTQALQLYVLSKGGFVTGALTMLVFALGTLPALLLLSAFSSFAKGAVQKHFLRFSGAALLVLGFLNFQSGAVLSGLGPLTHQPSAESGQTEAAERVHAVQRGDRQLVSMRVVDFSYLPNIFEVRQGVPVEWRIDASEAVGCGMMILAPGLRIRQLLSPVSTTLITFTPKEPGEFPFNCGMGMMTPGSKFIVSPAAQAP